jgi:hypothetical protein
MSAEELPVKGHRGSRLVDARLHLLDRQLLDEHDDPVGIVDDLELSGAEIPWKLVESVAVVVKLKATDMTFDVNWAEQWLRDHIIRHLPGGRHAAE